MNTTRWFNGNLKKTKEEDTEKEFAKISHVKFGIHKDYLCLEFKLNLPSGEKVTWIIDLEDIYSLLTKTKTIETNELNGKLLETYTLESKVIGISVNEDML